jgi:hypothetical protein
MYRSDKRLMGTGITSPKTLISVAVLATLVWQNVTPSSAASLIEVGRGARTAEFSEPASPLNDYDIALLIDKSRSMTRGLREVQETGIEPDTDSITSHSTTSSGSNRSNSTIRLVTSAGPRPSTARTVTADLPHENTGLPPEPEVLQRQAEIQNAVAQLTREEKSEQKSDQIEIIQEHRAIIAAEDSALSLKEKRALQQERHRQRAAQIHEEREALIRQKSAEREAKKVADVNKFSEYVPYEESRWAWCQKQAQALSAKLSAMQPDGIRTILFSDDVVENEKSDASQIKDLFHTTQPVGATRAAEPLRREFEKYFAQRAANPLKKTKPLLVAIITDGYMNDKRAVKMEIQRACNQLESGNEILVAFLTVGTAGNVPFFLKELDHLSPLRAKYDIVEVRSFDELDEKGLAGVLEELVTSRQKPIKTAQVQ